MGDLNLSHRIAKDQDKLNNLCQDNKVSMLNEITRSMSYNQLDYVLIDRKLKERSFVTSYHNFISDHKSIIARIGWEGNSLRDEIRMKINFDKESHLKSKSVQDMDCGSSTSSEDQDSIDELPESDSTRTLVIERNSYQNFTRKFKNVDSATCWLNSCLQLILTGIEHADSLVQFESELGEELKRLLKASNTNISLDPITVKNIIVAAEDTRIALRLSELEASIENEAELEHQIEVVRSLRYNLLEGQQCIRDLFLCLQENIVNWPDVCSHFYFTITYSTICCGCDRQIQSETDQMYVEVDVPPDNSSLSEFLEDYFCTSTLSARFCDDGCKTLSQAEKRSAIKLVKETEFILVILTRAMDSLDGFELNKNRTISTNELYIR